MVGRSRILCQSLSRWPSTRPAEGRIFITGRLKIDNQPIIGDGFHLRRLKPSQEKYFKAMVCDQLNAFEKAVTPNPKWIVIAALLQTIETEKNRALWWGGFSSNVARLVGLGFRSQRNGAVTSALIGRSANEQWSSAARVNRSLARRFAYYRWRRHLA